MTDAGTAIMLAGALMQAAPPLASIVHRARCRREAAEATASLPFTPVPADTPPDMLDLLAQLG